MFDYDRLLEGFLILFQYTAIYAQKKLWCSVLWCGRPTSSLPYPHKNKLPLCPSSCVWTPFWSELQFNPPMHQIYLMYRHIPIHDWHNSKVEYTLRTLTFSYIVWSSSYSKIIINIQKNNLYVWNTFYCKIRHKNNCSYIISYIRRTNGQANMMIKSQR